MRGGRKGKKRSLSPSLTIDTGASVDGLDTSLDEKTLLENAINSGEKVSRKISKEEREEFFRKALEESIAAAVEPSEDKEASAAREPTKVSASAVLGEVVEEVVVDDPVTKEKEKLALEPTEPTSAPAPSASDPDLVGALEGRGVAQRSPGPS